MQNNFSFDNGFKKFTGMENAQPQQQPQEEVVQQPQYQQGKVSENANLFNQPAYQEPIQQPIQQPQYKQPQQPTKVQTNIVSKKEQISTALSEKTISDKVLNSISKLTEEGQLTFREGYNVGNEVKLAYLNIVNNNLINTCDPISIANAIQDYAIQGLEISKKQAYFVGFGGKCTLMRSYFGDVALVKATNLVKNVKAYVIYQGDTFDMDYDDDNNLIISNHHTQFENLDKPIRGAYAIAENIDGTKTYCIMTWNEILKNWDLSKGKNRNTGEVKFQQDFPQEASKRTVIRRLVKMILNTSVNTNVYQQTLIESYNRTTENEYIGNADRRNDSIDAMGRVINEKQSSVKVEDDL